MDKLDELATKWSIAKQKEEAARLERLDIEEQLLALHPAKQEGSETFQTPNGVKIKLIGKLTYKVDIDKLMELTKHWNHDAKPFKTDVKADEAKLKMIRSGAPRLWAEIAQAVTITPAKTGVSIEFKE